MMERLLELAAKSADAASVYATDSVSDQVQFDNGKFKTIESSMQSGVSLLLLKDGRLGSAYTRNLLDRESLVDNALAAIKGGVEAGYELPLTRNLPRLSTYDESIERMTNGAAVEECGRVCDWLSERTGTQINTIAVRSTANIAQQLWYRPENTDLGLLPAGFSSVPGFLRLDFPRAVGQELRPAAGRGPRVHRRAVQRLQA
jgi:PmbA protein